MISVLGILLTAGVSTVAPPGWVSLSYTVNRFLTNLQCLICDKEEVLVINTGFIHYVL